MSVSNRKGSISNRPAVVLIVVTRDCYTLYRCSLYALLSLASSDQLIVVGIAFHVCSESVERAIVKSSANCRWKLRSARGKDYFFNAHLAPRIFRDIRFVYTLITSYMRDRVRFFAAPMTD